jgi:hypothetical protein
LCPELINERFTWPGMSVWARCSPPTLFPYERAAGWLAHLHGVDLLGIEPEIEVASIALGHRFRPVSSGFGIRHWLPAEWAVEDEPEILGLEVIRVSSDQVESEAAEREERLAGDPGQLAVELSLGHVVLLPALPRAVQSPCAKRTGRQERVETPGWVMGWRGRRRR